MKKYIFLFLLVILLFPARIYSDTVENTHSLNMLMIIVDRLSIDELILADTANIDYLQEKGAFSLMNVRTAGHLHPESTYLTANAGNRSQGSKMSHCGKSFGNGALNDKISELSALNRGTNYQAKPGLLGDIARDNDISIAVLGNSDNIDEDRKTVVTMMMDSEGFVPYAEIGKEILEDLDLPWGYLSDYKKMQEYFLEFKEIANTLVIETGDMTRIEEYYQKRRYGYKNYSNAEDNNYSSVNDNNYTSAENNNKLVKDNNKVLDNSKLLDRDNLLSNEYNNEKDNPGEIYQDYYKYKKEALERLDKFIGFILENIDLEETQIAILSPTPSYHSLRKNENLGWIFLSGREIEPGWLSSSTTRRKGIISITDMLAIFSQGNKISDDRNKVKIENIAEKLKINSRKTRTENRPLFGLSRMNKRISFIYQIRSPFIKGFIFLQLLVIILAVLKMSIKKISKLIIFNKSFEYLLLAILLVPINFIFISVINIFSLKYLIILLILLSIFQVFILLKFFNSKLNRVFIILSFLILIICIDLLFNNYFLADTILGYSSVLGARYYGLGNEYMGFFLSGVLLATAFFLEIIRQNSFKDGKFSTVQYLLPFIYLFFAYFIAAANLGANFGGMLTALFAFAFTYYYSIKKGHIQVIIACIVFMLVILYLDYSGFFGVSSHIGQATDRLLEADWQWLSNTVLRKFSMNLKLLRWTIWTRVLLAMIIYLFIMIRKPSYQIKIFFNRYPYIKSAFYGALLASLLTMFVNDSGVVAAATILFYPVMALLYLVD
ncbi:MAG: hypothetical protein ACOCQO_00080 [Halanaerobiaceae bacterium]